MRELKTHNHLFGKAALLEEEIKVQQAAMRLMSQDGGSTLAAAQLRLERLETLLKALRQVLLIRP